MSRHDEMAMYSITENSSQKITIIFESAATTLTRIISAAEKAIRETYSKEDNPFTMNGYQVYRYSPVAVVAPVSNKERTMETERGPEKVSEPKDDEVEEEVVVKEVDTDEEESEEEEEETKKDG